ncbi:MAG: membrane protein insertion efficiency factor YidD [Burkholderiaceae bacterium]|jgi:putative membrane protein insertion efficiency factor|uniref:membrane protein insertion efficiency factor YidD n=1 Tax=Polynucleobacter sp. MWH-Loch1C5 TaxID=2689108 RepID=UPI001C0DCC0A|nr:membrane protein insertion efficiency factor YidD [Polynucleobacter sp. MWH-Loch1C5]MBU3542470.1 membrane protein insertion efficiency factor YidD [Polynucleobacter sp. MWH-Loch1C5]NBV00085.1 membrane protein insertion efficiency factor YidD [Burkholderiaceae bacterium]
MLKKILKGLIRFYQLTLSPFWGSQCRFHPTCSHYAIEAIDKHGALKGFFMAIWRILRCNPFAKGGLDPVPEKSREKKT